MTLDEAYDAITALMGELDVIVSELLEFEATVTSVFADGCVVEPASGKWNPARIAHRANELPEVYKAASQPGGRVVIIWTDDEQEDEEDNE